MPVERRERVIAIWLGSTGNGRNPMFNGRRQPSRGGTSRMMREYQVRYCERLGGKFPGLLGILDVVSRGCKPFLVRRTPNSDRKFNALVPVAKCQQRTHAPQQPPIV